MLNKSGGRGKFKYFNKSGHRSYLEHKSSAAPYNLRKHNYNISKDSFKLDKYKYFFTNRVVNTWNNLNTDAVNADTTNSFKNKIDKHFKNIMFSIQ